MHPGWRRALITEGGWEGVGEDGVGAECRRAE